MGPRGGKRAQKQVRGRGARAAIGAAICEPARPGPAGAPLFSPRSSHAQAPQPSVVYFLLLTMAAAELFYGILVLPANLPRSDSLGSIGLSF